MSAGWFTDIYPRSEDGRSAAGRHQPLYRQRREMWLRSSTVLLDSTHAVCCIMWQGRRNAVRRQTDILEERRLACGSDFVNAVGNWPRCRRSPLIPPLPRAAPRW